MKRYALRAAFLAGFAAISAKGETEGPPPPAGPGFDEAVRSAVERGLAYLASRQNPNGSWINRVGYKLYDNYYGEDQESVDVTALAGMAFAAGGNLPGRGRYGRNVEQGVRWLISKVREEDGYITHAGSRMYSHAFATLFLAEIYGMTRQADLKPYLRRAVDLLIASQNREGGWRYQPIPVDADLSVTVSALQALRAARNVGIAVPPTTIERATRYVLRCATPRGFRYQCDAADYGARNDTRISFALTACGIVSLYSAGLYDSRELRDALQVLRKWNHSGYVGKLHYFYGHYYAAQAMYMAGGEDWTNYYARLKEELLGPRMQAPAGYWEDDVGRNYATAMACLILQIPCEYLPIFQK